MWTRELLEEIEKGKKINELRSSLNMSSSELRAAVRSLKQAGVPLVRKGNAYLVERVEVPQPKLRTFSDVLTVAKEATKVLRFVYGEGVKYLWPNMVLKDKNVILEISVEGFAHRLPEYLYATVLRRASSALRGRKMPEVVASLNALLYKEPIRILTTDGEVKGIISNVDINGNARIGDVRVNAKDVKKVIIV